LEETQEERMQDKIYAVVALEEILTRALDAVEAHAAPPSTGTSLDKGKMTAWDLEFAQMPREKQVVWLTHLFEALVKHG
jgi:hypothetical protein